MHVKLHTSIIIAQTFYNGNVLLEQIANDDKIFHSTHIFFLHIFYAMPEDATQMSLQI